MAKLAHCLRILVVFLSSALVVHSLPTLCTYSVNVKTGNKDYADTDAVVSLHLEDMIGLYVDAPNLESYGTTKKNYFERDQLDHFSIPGKCMYVCKIILSHNNANNQPGWYIDYLDVQIYSILNVTHPLLVQHFSIDQWLSKDDPPYSLSLTKNKCLTLLN